MLSTLEGCDKLLFSYIWSGLFVCCYVDDDFDWAVLDLCFGYRDARCEFVRIFSKDLSDYGLLLC